MSCSKHERRPPGNDRFRFSSLSPSKFHRRCSCAVSRKLLTASSLSSKASWSFAGFQVHRGLDPLLTLASLQGAPHAHDRSRCLQPPANGDVFADILGCPAVTRHGDRLAEAEQRSPRSRLNWPSKSTEPNSMPAPHY
jgi:hypothetical protein